VQVHLVAVEVGVEGRTDAFVKTKCAVWLDNGVKCHDTELVQAGLAVEEDYVIVDEVTFNYVAVLE